LLLLHGGLETADDLPELARALSQRYRVIAPERRGHGRTPDVPGPISYSAMAADTLALMEAVGLNAAHLVGYSDGANVAMQLAIAHPCRVSRLVLIGGNFHAEGMTEAFREGLRAVNAEAYEQGFRERYARLSPDGPEHWRVVFGKVRRMWLEEPTLTSVDLQRIEAPALVIAGNADFVRLEHAIAMAEAVAGAELMLLPGKADGLLREQPVLTAISEFLSR
jgi:pimeloyl-ACP methyl ester carboxylesterase